MKQGLKTALVVLGLVVAAAPFWVALTIPFEKFEVPRSASRPNPPPSNEILADLARWDAATTPYRRAAAEDVARRLPDFALLRMETFSCGGQTHEVAIYRHAKTEMEFALVPGGTFLMGSPESEKGRLPDETQHRVTLTNPFLIARTLCTQAAYEKITGANPSIFKGAAFPVEMASWDEATSFCGKAGLELPTEAKWEYACRAGTTTAYCFGDDEGPLGDFAWYVRTAASRTHPVALKNPNAFGLFDILGNVLEWCEDRYGDYPSGVATDPRGPGGGAERVTRGGSWADEAGTLRCAARLFRVPPEARGPNFGFRPAKTIPTE